MSSLLFAILRNCRSKRINRDFLGYNVEKDIGQIRREDADAYAQAILDKNPNYHGKAPIVTPFFPARLVVDMVMKICTMKNLKLNLLKMVHGEQEVIWHHPVRVGDQLTAKAGIANIEDTSAGELITISGNLFCNGKMVAESNTGFLVRGKTSVEKKERQPEKERAELFRLDIQTKDGQQIEYARASGDSNFIHTSNFLAKLAGLPRTILQGFCIVAMACSSLSEKVVSNDLSRLRSIKGRFSGIVIPGDLLELVAYEGDQPSEILFEILNPKGRTILKNGVFTFKEA